MPRNDIHLDAMLRHLGAAYYESLHGRAARSDVARALDTVEDHLKEHPVPVPPPTRRALEQTARETRHDGAPSGGPSSGQSGGPGGNPRRRYARRVRDVMTTTVITVDRITPYKEIAQLLTEHRISGMPVLSMGRHVVGVVSEADLLAVEDKRVRQARASFEAGERHWLRRAPQPALVAGDLMTSPPVTIHPDATIPAAARVMNASHVRRLPVVDPDGKLIGIVSRRDLLSVFLRPDSQIAADAREVLDEILLAEPGDATVSVRNGVVTLTGTLKSAAGQHTDLVPVAIRLLWDIDGVVDVVNRIGEVKAALPLPLAGDTAPADVGRDRPGLAGDRAPLVLGHQAWLDQLEVPEEAEDAVPGAGQDRLARPLVDLHRTLGRRLVGKEFAANVADHQVAAGHKRVAHPRDDAVRVVVLGDEVQDREQDHRDRPAEVQVLAQDGIREQFARPPEVGRHDDRLVPLGEQRLTVPHDDRVVIDVADAHLRVNLMRDLVDRALRRQPHPDVEKLLDAGLGRQIAHDPPQEPPVLQRRPALPGHER